MKRSTLVAIMSVAVLATGAMAIESCSAKRGPDDAGLMVIVTTDGRIEVDSLQVFVWKDKQGTEKEARTSNVYKPVALPNTVAILSDGNPTAVAVIKVVAYNKAGVVVDVRDRIVQRVPIDRVAAVPIVLSVNCLSKARADKTSECGAGTCNPSTGGCMDSNVVGSGLDTYVPGAVVDGGVGILDTSAPDTSVSDTADARDGDTTVSETSDTLLVDSDSAVVDTGCAKGTKLCGATCQPTDVAHGCAELSCEACPTANGTATCSAAGACELTCGSGFKKCSRACVSIDDPTYGCGPTTCDNTACPVPDGGTLTCSGGACVIGSCGSGTKKCGSACVTTDVTNGCSDASKCTPCGAKEACVGTPSVCTCVSDATATTCSGKCGVVKDNCGKDVTCPGCTLPATCGGGGVNVCGVCDLTTTYPPAPSCHPGNREWPCWLQTIDTATRTLDYSVRTLCGTEVVVDAKTKLMWARNEEVGAFTWENAKKACTDSRRAGFADWRLPTAVELQSIVDYQKTTKPTIDTAKFEGPSVGSTPTPAFFWSSSSYSLSSGNAWNVYFDFAGLVTFSTVGTANAVRCVR